MKKFLMFTLLAGFIAGMVSSPAFAAEKKKKKKKQDLDAVFKKLDKDGDKKLTLEEVKGKRTGKKAERAEKLFKRLDKDKDGSLTLEEFKNLKKKKKKK